MRRLFRFLIAMIGGGIFAALALGAVALLKIFVPSEDFLDAPWKMATVAIAAGTVAAVLIFLFSSHILTRLENTEKRVSKMSVRDVGALTLGLIVGLVLAFLVSRLFATFPTPLDIIISVCLYIILGSTSARFVYKKREEFAQLFRASRKEKEDSGSNPAFASGKLLDSSVIIDSRVLDVIRTGFLEGPVLVPGFVLAELQHISDSADELRRARGRRGLDVVARIQSETDCAVEILSEDPADIPDVDTKLIFLAKKYGYSIVTNDFNLNKLARVQGVRVLNINDLANAVKPVVTAGESLQVKIVREGKEPGQGVAYLDDGTMIVIENGASQIGQTLSVIVSSSLQTSAGRMIFAKLP
ncbi:MAG: PIN/TRAM domain-containing protein [Christensenellales bacterium]|jgi:uncharacterized protein YacL